MFTLYRALRNKIDLLSIAKQVSLPMNTEAQEDIDTTVTHKSLTLFRFLFNHVVHEGKSLAALRTKGTTILCLPKRCLLHARKFDRKLEGNDIC